MSLLLHLGFLLLILPQQKGLLSIGTTGEGELEGAGTALTLVDAREIQSPQALRELLRTPLEKRSEPSTTQVEPEDTKTDAKATDIETPVQEHPAANQTTTPPSGSPARVESTLPSSAGAFGQNGEAYTDLWNAIAPCWNRVANMKTLAATLIISFNADGGLSAPPVIERGADAAITGDSLNAEAKALQALSECGLYPMATSLKDVTVKFPAPGQTQDSGGRDLATTIDRPK